ncbi:unnamed protein product, partial [Amoebophrya sp. A25]
MANLIGRFVVERTEATTQYCIYTPQRQYAALREQGTIAEKQCGIYIRAIDRFREDVNHLYLVALRGVFIWDTRPLGEGTPRDVAR